MNGTPSSSSPGISGFIEIFDGRLNKMKLHQEAKQDTERNA